MEQKLLIEDNSGDKNCFTIVPNYILNHSTATDQALYLQMKRLSGGGEKDCCYPSIRYLKKQLGIGETNIKKSIKYLVKHKWIDSLGKRQIHTAGGMQWVSSYKINNIWKLNNEEYKGVPNIDPLKEVSPIMPKVSPETGKVSPVIPCNKERIKNLQRRTSSSNKLKPYFRRDEMRFSQNKWWVLPSDGSEWLEFAGKKEDITWK